MCPVYQESQSTTNNLKVYIFKYFIKVNTIIRAMTPRAFLNILELKAIGNYEPFLKKTDEISFNDEIQTTKNLVKIKNSCTEKMLTD